jgi:hypothetical protein
VTLRVRDEWVSTRFGDKDEDGVGAGIRVGVNVTPEPLMAFDEVTVHELPQSCWLFPLLEKSLVNWLLYAKAVCPLPMIITLTSNTINVGIAICFILIPGSELTYIKPAVNVQLI